MPSDVIVHQVAGEFVVADGGGWLPGVYDSAEAATFAASRDYDQLVALWHAHPKYQSITMADLVKLKEGEK